MRIKAIPSATGSILMITGIILTSPGTWLQAGSSGTQNGIIAEMTAECSQTPQLRTGMMWEATGHGSNHNQIEYCKSKEGQAVYLPVLSDAVSCGKFHCHVLTAMSQPPFRKTNSQKYHGFKRIF